MKILALSDIHGNVPAVEAFADVLRDADMVLLAGDLTHFGGSDDAARVVAAARRHNPRVLAVPGNCDRPDVAAYLEKEGISLHGRHEIIEGLAFLGVGGSLPAPGRTPNEFTEGELAAFLAEAAEGLDHALPWVLVSHQPPRDTALDRVGSGMHVGSRAVREFIERERPAVCFTGHIHESSGLDSLGPTRMANPGPARGGRYANAVIGKGLETLEIRALK